MKQFLISILFFLMPLALQSQTLDISTLPDHADHGHNTFPVGHTTLQINPDGIVIDNLEIKNPVSWSLSKNNNRVATLEREDELILTLYDLSGRRLMQRPLEFFDPFDQTLSIYLFSDGRVILRDNVANFTFLNPKGETLYSVSNSSQSQDGESESRIARDESGRTIVLYNPVISFGNSTGSRAKIIFAENDEQLLYNSPDKEITDLKVSQNGSFITLLAVGSGQSEVSVYDRFGNELYRYETDDALMGVHLTPNGDYITKYTSGRVQTFNTITGEVAGSSSSRGAVIEAVYFPDDETIIMIGGVINAQSISDPTISAVHLGQRQIVRENINEMISLPESGEISFNRKAAGQYTITGMNKQLNVTARF